MAEPRTVTAYTDYKSPYAYLAKDLAYEFERDFGVQIDWLPYVLDIPSFLGSARGRRKREGDRGAAQPASMAAGALQLYGLPPAGEEARLGDPR